MAEYYDGTKILSLNDINNKKPELYLVTTNRTGGKTTYFGRMVVNRFIKSKRKFALLYRYNYELDGCGEKFFKDLQGLFFRDYDLENKRRAKGIFHELFLNGESCGYALALNGADQIKKYSHLFSDVDSIIFDEFQSETNHYCADEIRKFISVHTSIARGQGEQVRYVPVYMLGNPVSIINPYYTELGVCDRLRSDTKFLRGNGWVLEQGYNESASLAQKESGFNKAFAKNDYVAYSSQGVYLNDSKAFISKPLGTSSYLCTIKYYGVSYGVRAYTDEGVVYVDDSPDLSHPNRLVVNTSDHDVNYVMLRRNDMLIYNLRYYFDKGCFRFKNASCKEAIIKILSY